MSDSITRMFQKHRVVVCVGAGGVGKTTISAAVGVAAARDGLRALVLTVDPARRLANALGLSDIGVDIQEIPVELFIDEHHQDAQPLHVAMLDVKSTFDRIVRRHAPDDAAYQAIIDNIFYKQASTALAGSQEYMAMERLFEVVHDHDYDLIVLDTPPSTHALDFLDAPQRMIDLFDSRAFRLLLRSFRRSRQPIGGLFRPGSLVMRGLDRFTGIEMFHGLLNFFQAMSSTFDGFVARAGEVLQLISSDQTTFIIVSGCDNGSINEGLFLHRRLRQQALGIGCWVLNRMRSYTVLPPGCGDDLVAQVEATLSEVDSESSLKSRHQTAEKIAYVSSMLADLTQHDQRLHSRLIEALPKEELLITVPRTRDEPTDVAGLCQVADLLSAGTPT